MSESLDIRSSDDVVRVRQRVRAVAVEAGLGLVDQLARNTLDYGGGGRVNIELVTAPRRGLRLEFVDQGPGIKDVDVALRDGFTTGKGLGLGLGGAKRLSSEFHIESTPGQGTRVHITRWK